MGGGAGTVCGTTRYRRGPSPKSLAPVPVSLSGLLGDSGVHDR